MQYNPESVETQWKDLCNHPALELKLKEDERLPPSFVWAEFALTQEEIEQLSLEQIGEGVRIFAAQALLMRIGQPTPPVYEDSSVPKDPLTYVQFMVLFLRNYLGDRHLLDEKLMLADRDEFFVLYPNIFDEFKPY